MVKKLLQVELTTGRKNISSEGISDGRSEVPGGKRTNKNGRNESDLNRVG